jgi:hypothetical protein
MAAIAAGLIWGLFNVGFAMILSFGPSLFVERGWTITGAGSIVSIVLWLSVLSIALGGFAGLMLLLAHASTRVPADSSSGPPGSLLMSPIAITVAITVRWASAKWSGSAATALHFGALALLACPLLLLLFNRIAQAVRPLLDGANLPLTLSVVGSNRTLKGGCRVA